jgi:phosphoribosylanthranilate isomerase
MGLLIKVCGLRLERDLEACAALGVDMTGFIFHPASPRSVSPEEVARLPRLGPQRVGVFVRQDAAEILACQDQARLDLIQLHGDQGRGVAQAVGPKRVIHVLWPERYTTQKELQEHLYDWAGYCSLFILDSGASGGGHGRSVNVGFSWSGLEFPRPWLLAGGLNVSTVQEKIDFFQPDGIDLNSGVETRPGVKECGSLNAAVKVARAQRQVGKARRQ